MRLSKPVSIVAAILLAAALTGPADAAKSRPAPTSTHHIDMLYVTLVKATTETNLGQYTTPQAGNVFLSVWLRIVDRNDVQKGFSTSDFKALSPDGGQLDSQYNTPTPKLNDTVLSPRYTAYGSITFEVPKGQHHVVLEWAPSPPHYNEHWPTATWTVFY